MFTYSTFGFSLSAPCSTAYVPDKNQIELAVAHFSEGNMEIIQPLKVTNTHVIIEVQNLSLFGLLKKWIFQEIPISAQVLLFYQKMEIGRKLHIYLLPGNVPLKEVFCFNLYIYHFNFIIFGFSENVFVMNINSTKLSVIFAFMGSS